MNPWGEESNRQSPKWTRVLQTYITLFCKFQYCFSMKKLLLMKGVTCYVNIHDSH